MPYRKQFARSPWQQGGPPFGMNRMGGGMGGSGFGGGVPMGMGGMYGPMGMGGMYGPMGMMGSGFGHNPNYNRFGGMGPMGMMNMGYGMGNMSRMRNRRNQKRQKKQDYVEVDDIDDEEGEDVDDDDDDSSENSEMEEKIEEKEEDKPDDKKDETEKSIQVTIHHGAKGRSVNEEHNREQTHRIFLMSKKLATQVVQYKEWTQESRRVLHKVCHICKIACGTKKKLRVHMSSNAHKVKMENMLMLQHEKVRALEARMKSPHDMQTDRY